MTRSPAQAQVKAIRPSGLEVQPGGARPVVARQKVTRAAAGGTRPIAGRGQVGGGGRAGSLQAAYRSRLLRLVNAERAAHGVGPVGLHTTLNGCARRHNGDLAFVQRRLSHVGRDGAALGTRLRRCGYQYKYASENVARGQGSPQHVVRSWMKSEGHRKNLLSDRVKHMGVHVGRGVDGKLYWAQLFGTPRGVPMATRR